MIHALKVSKTWHIWYIIVIICINSFGAYEYVCCDTSDKKTVFEGVAYSKVCYLSIIKEFWANGENHAIT